MKHRYRIPAVALAAALLTSLPSLSLAVDVDREFEFASGLVELNFPDLATRVVEQVLRQHPDQKERANRVRGEIYLKQRRMADAEKLMAEMPPRDPQTHALRIQIANAYFRLGEVDKARRLYNEYFAFYKDRAPDEPELLRFYQEASYVFAQMLERAGDLPGAAVAFQRLLDAGLDDENAERKLKYDLAQLYLRAGRDATGNQKKEFLDKSFELCRQIQWGGYDVWFGQSISVMAHVELARGKEAEARALLRDYMDDLETIDRRLREADYPSALSPMAGARFLLGELYERQYRQMKQSGASEGDRIVVLGNALRELFNVFARYGDSDWGPQAGVRGRAVQAILENEYGRTVNVNWADHMAKVVQTQFRLADDHFRQRQYKDAIEQYLMILNSFPEAEPSMRALANVSLSYAHLEDTLYVRMMMAYLAERFAGKTVPGNAMLAVGRIYVDREDDAFYTSIFDQFFDAFPTHERTPALLFDMARRSAARGERVRAAEYYARLIENYPEDRFALRAMFQLGMAAYEDKIYDVAAENLKKYVDLSRPGFDRVRAQFLVADALQQQRLYREALQAYGQVISWAGRPGTPDNARPEDAERNADFVEKAMFFLGYTFGRMREPADQVDTYRGRAIAAYRQFLSQHPDSSLAPKAMQDTGAMQLALGQSDEAARTFETLAERYPDSAEGRSALFALVSSALDIGEKQIARDAFRRMIETPDEYSAEEYTRIGQLLLDAGMYEDVIPAYERVVETTDDQRMLQMALFGLGTAYRQQGDHAKAVQSLERLLERFPQSPFFYDAQLRMAQSSREIEQYPKAIAALSNILRFSQDNLRNQRAQYELAQVQQAAGEKTAALASYQRITLFQDPRDPRNEAIRGIIESSVRGAALLAMELEMYEEVIELADQYNNDFPRGEHLEAMRNLRRDALVRQ